MVNVLRPPDSRILGCRSRNTLELSQQKRNVLIDMAIFFVNIQSMANKLEYPFTGSMTRLVAVSTIELIKSKMIVPGQQVELKDRLFMAGLGCLSTGLMALVEIPFLVLEVPIDGIIYFYNSKMGKAAKQ